MLLGSLSPPTCFSTCHDIIDPWVQVQELIDVFPDEDEHLKMICKGHPESMTVEELMTILKCSVFLQSGRVQGGWEECCKGDWRSGAWWYVSLSLSLSLYIFLQLAT